MVKYFQHLSLGFIAVSQAMPMFSAPDDTHPGEPMDHSHVITWKPGNIFKRSPEYKTLQVPRNFNAEDLMSLFSDFHKDNGISYGYNKRSIGYLPHRFYHIPANSDWSPSQTAHYYGVSDMLKTKRSGLSGDHNEGASNGLPKLTLANLFGLDSNFDPKVHYNKEMTPEKVDQILHRMHSFFDDLHANGEKPAQKKVKDASEDNVDIKVSNFQGV